MKLAELIHHLNNALENHGNKPIFIGDHNKIKVNPNPAGYIVYMPLGIAAGRNPDGEFLLLTIDLNDETEGAE